VAPATLATTTASVKFSWQDGPMLVAGRRSHFHPPPPLFGVFAADGKSRMKYTNIQGGMRMAFTTTARRAARACEENQRGAGEHGRVPAERDRQLAPRTPARRARRSQVQRPRLVGRNAATAQGAARDEDQRAVRGARVPLDAWPRRRKVILLRAALNFNRESRMKKSGLQRNAFTVLVYRCRTARHRWRRR
jgi:hypothetical protein